ncbi:hypothetical protein LLH23_01760 [bacterium]|nr:hypothetical protein [bacterium]
MAIRMLFASVCCCLISLAAAQEQAPAPRPQPSPGVNLALGKPCTFSPAPNYGLCTDPGDATDLTDGVYNGCEWRDKGTVGWGVGRTKSFTVDLDLGSEQPVGKITLDTVTGGAQVTFPSAALVFLSSDGREYRFVGDVLTESLPQDKFLSHRFVLDGIKGWGRYVRFVLLPGGFYLFCDEIEVLKGDHTAAQATWGDDRPIAAADVAAYALDRKPWVDQKNTTLALVRQAAGGVEQLRAMKAPPAACDTAAKAIEQARREALATATVTPADYWQGPPYREPERKAFAAVGALNDAMWPATPVVVWQDKHWNRLNPVAVPVLAGKPEIRVEMMQNEFACSSLNLTSASALPLQLTVRLADFRGPQVLPAATAQLAQCIHTEAFGYNYPDDAIVPLAVDTPPASGPRNGLTARLALPAGLSKRLWLTFKTRGLTLKPGVYTSTLTVNSIQVPVRLRVSALRFPDAPAMQSNTWGYFNEKVVVGRELEVAQNLLDHYNTSLVLNHSYLPYPKPDAQGNFTVPLDFTKMDQMIEWNPQCRFWLLWAGFEFGFDRLGTAKFGGPVWDKVFEQWVTQIRDHLAEKGIGRDRFAWYWRDEPGDKAWREQCVPASQALKRVDPQMLTWENPVESVTPAMLEEALPSYDLYCPSIGEVANTARVEVCRRTKLPSWLYACASEKNSDPCAYYRWLAWKAFKLGFGGLGMWVYVDGNCATPSDYTSGVSYALIYGWPDRVVDSKRWEAWRQGIADVEYLRMLREAAPKGSPATAKEAEELLAAGVDSVVGDSPHQGDVMRPDAADEVRLRVLQCLEKLSETR